MSNIMAAYNPDVLSCLANLSNDEVFTPPEIANKMLDMLPQELFKSPDTKFLDPACKSGVFLREIAKRLLEGLMPGYKDWLERIEDKKRENEELDDEEKEFLEQLQATVDHIFKEQLYGIAITELTSLLSRRSLYCSKYPNSDYSVTKFDTPSGNIRFVNKQHRFKDGKCVFCGANAEQYDREEGLESHAYEFIHTVKPEEILNMKFDVIIGNPPYQLSTGGSKAQAIPLYNKFVEQAKKLNPRYLTMIIPSRWFAGGMGLDSFRESMLTERKISNLVDYPNAKDCFPGISLGGGVCYFLWSREYDGDCEFTNINNGKATTLMRKLDEFPVLVRYNEAISIIHKVLQKKEESLSSIVSALSPFGIGSAERGKDVEEINDAVIYSSNGKGFYPRSSVKQGLEYLDKFKIMISKVTSEHAGEPGKDGTFKVISKMQLLKPNEICTFSYFLIGNSDSKIEVKNILTYLSTKFVRFLLLQAVSSINISKDKFRFIPMQDFSKPWTDEELYAKYELTQEEIDFIESMIKPMDLGGDDNG